MKFLLTFIGITGVLVLEDTWCFLGTTPQPSDGFKPSVSFLRFTAKPPLSLPTLASKSVDAH